MISKSKFISFYALRMIFFYFLKVISSLIVTLYVAMRVKSLSLSWVFIFWCSKQGHGHPLFKAKLVQAPI